MVNSHLPHKPLVIVTLVIMAGLIGVGVGFSVKWACDAIAMRSLNQQQMEKTRIILEQMGTFALGDTISLMGLESLNGPPLLTDLIIGDGVWIIVVDPACQACEVNLARIKREVPSRIQETELILICKGNRDAARNLQINLALDIPILYDPGSEWSDGYHIFTFPFSILVDSSLVVREVVAGTLSTDQITANYPHNLKRGGDYSANWKCENNDPVICLWTFADSNPSVHGADECSGI